MTSTMPPRGDYPVDLVETAFLDDGTEIVFRPIRPDDAARLERLFWRLSPETRYRRFFTPMARPDPRMMQRLANVDYVDRLAIVASVGDEIIGVARYDRIAALAPPALRVDPGEAEAAIVVEDAWHARGIGTRLLWRLTAAARQRGVTAFTADVLASNTPMMGLLKAVSPQASVRLEEGRYVVRLPLDTVAP